MLYSVCLGGQSSYIFPVFRHSFATLPMSRASAPTLRRNHSSSDGSCVDPYDKAEQGFQIGSEDLSGPRPPLEAQKIHSFRSSLRSSDSTLVGLPEDAVDDSRRPLPDQGMVPNRLPSQIYTNCIRSTLSHNLLDIVVLR
jgi:hypothetical protein